MNIPPEFDRDLSRLSGVTIRTAVRGTALTTFFIGGSISKLLEPDDVKQLATILSLLPQIGQVPSIIGAGSNLLIDDRGIEGYVLRLGRGFRGFRPLGNGRFDVAAGTSLMSLSRELSEAGFSGLEFAGGIPATIGGAIRMNAGAHGGEIAAIVESIQVLLGDGQAGTLAASELQFDYRHSQLPLGAIIVSAVIKLQQTDRSKCVDLRNKNLSRRKASQPLHQPSAGSVFRNPRPDLSAGYLIERAGLKGLECGAAKISEMHANWIVNPKRNASAFEVQSLISTCIQQVREKEGIELVPEIIFWGA